MKRFRDVAIGEVFYLLPNNTSEVSPFCFVKIELVASNIIGEQAFNARNKSKFITVNSSTYVCGTSVEQKQKLDEWLSRFEIATDEDEPIYELDFEVHREEGFTELLIGGGIEQREEFENRMGWEIDNLSPGEYTMTIEINE